MGMLSSSFLDLIDKAKSWIFLRTNNLTYLTSEFKMVESDRNTCSECETDSTRCKFCWEIKFRNERNKRFCDKIYPSDSPRQSPEPPSPCFSGEKSDGYSPNRSDNDADDSPSTFFSQSSEYFHVTSDVDSSSISATNIFHSFTSAKGTEDPEYSDESPSNLSIFRDECEKAQKPLDFENNGLLWFPPPLEDDGNNSYNSYEDEDDEIGYTGAIFSSCSSLVSSKNKPNEALVQGHFRALVSQLLRGEDIKFGKESWLDIVTDIAWKAANYVRPDTSRGGSMDPGDYVKIKCIASGNPNESTFVKGVICTKNVKHKRMNSQYRNPRLLLLGGALEYQKIPNQLSSFQTLLQQENDYLKLIVSKIEAYRPNVVLVEKSVSSYAQELLLENGISLVLNVKRQLLERIGRCTGANIIPSVDSFSTTRVGHCEEFRLEKVLEELEKDTINQLNKKSSKTLMFFEGCPRRFGCTVLLKGSYRGELKKVKRVVQFAVFAAYHLSLETSFLADEGATLPNKITIESSSSSEDDLVNQKLAPKHVENALTSLPECQLGCNDIGDVAQQEQQDLSADTVERESRDRETLTARDEHPSLLVSFSSRCVLNGTLCERSRLIRFTFYGCFDKPLGRYLQDDLFHQRSSCESCKEPASAHVYCFSHQKGNLTINVRSLPCSVKKLPGEQDGKIWMWHRCLKCPLGVDGVPPPGRLMLMSDAAWGLSFGKFLELSFLNNTAANRVATCGHSLQKDCLRYYGCGSMVAFFRYSPIDILSVYLPPSVLDFSSCRQQEWIKKEAAKLLGETEALYVDLFAILDSLDLRSMPSEDDVCELHDHLMNMKEELVKEGRDYKGLLQNSVDILELNQLRRSLVIGSHVWKRRFYSLDSLVKTRRSVGSNSTNDDVSSTEMNESSSNSFSWDRSIYHSNSFFSCHDYCPEDLESDLSDKIDSAWTGTDFINNNPDNISPHFTPTLKQKKNPAFGRLQSPARVYSFDSALRLQDRIRKGDQISYVQRSHSQISSIKAYKLNSEPLFISSALSVLPEGLFFPQIGQSDLVIAVYENEPTSIVSYALSTKEYQNWMENMPSGNERASHSFGFPEWKDYTHYGSYESSSVNFLFVEPSKNSPHVRIEFEDECGGEKVKFSSTCYFAKEFEALRKKCCPNQLDFIRSLSRCKGWSAQGGKSNVYFAKSLDDRFIIKQVQRTELESFQEFAPDYFKYLNESLSTSGPTSLAKILGIYQVTVKHFKGSKDMKIDVMVMENIFAGRSISKIYDLKGSVRSRYNADPSGIDQVLLDMNFLETMRTKPMFLGSKAKRSLERAVWNDTSFLASVDVMDYSLLVGVDHERNELVLGIIDYMRQYTWDKHLETWVKASLVGPNSASPTIVSPKQYKKRFRKAMTTYFLTVPDQWSS